VRLRGENSRRRVVIPMNQVEVYKAHSMRSLVPGSHRQIKEDGHIANIYDKPTVVKKGVSEIAWLKKNGQRLEKARKRAVPPHIRHRIKADIIKGSLSILPVCLRHRQILPDPYPKCPNTNQIPLSVLYNTNSPQEAYRYFSRGADLNSWSWPSFGGHAPFFYDSSTCRFVRKISCSQGHHRGASLCCHG